MTPRPLATNADRAPLGGREITAQRLARRAANAAKRKSSVTGDRGYLAYRRRLQSERETIARTGRSPWERAVSRIERLTGVPAEKWERNSLHPYTIAATKAAQILAGLS